MPIGDITGVLPPQLMHEAVRLVFEVVSRLHAVTANHNGVLFALAASPQLADSLAAFGASFEDDEDDGSAEALSGLTPEALAALLAPAPLQGHAVPPWTSPAAASIPAEGPDLARLFPGLVRPVEDVS